MKKALSLILALVMCLSLCACGGEQNNEIQGNEEIPNHLLLQNICGEWVRAPHDQAPCQSLMISEDGSCVVDGVSATWKIDSSYTNDTSIGMQIYINNELRFGVVLFNAELMNNDDLMNVTMPLDKTFSNSPMYIGGGSFVRKAELIEITEENWQPEPQYTTIEPQYTTIELTVDNWDTYFEEVTIPRFSKNAFGEVDDFDLEYYLQLKEEYYPLLNRVGTSIVIEIAYNYGERVCSVDFENQTYELGERITTVSTTAIEDWFDDYDGRFLCSPYGVIFYDDGEVRYYEDTEILRVKGTLCLRVE
jgi:hypothetical protein